MSETFDLTRFALEGFEDESPTLYAPENRLMLRTLPWGVTYVVTMQCHTTKVST
ncbi:hypothetical protein BCV71DRAFT_264582 [Rhizopus microsporus]|uniref:Uncharacterized protein n=1 Tax=Rhizopus microsporus TaxID=58291 RepID=A0A1X0S060_RHIZD|nr:hypothetical protein BCV71DRAFT_264582 [Rhizopus microsporus]